MEITNTNIINKIEWFDFIKVFLTDKATYSKLTNKAKEPHVFMTYRTLSIAYPTAIQELNNCRDIAVLDALHLRLCKDKGRVPQWLYTKADPPKKYVGVLNDYERPVINLLIQTTDWETKTLNWLANFEPEFLKTKLDEYKAILENKVKKGKTKVKTTPKKSSKK